MDALSTALFWLDFAAVAVFGATGALAAARRKHDIITFGFFAAITGVGGGTLRDLLIGAPVFWVGRPGYIIACLIAAAAIWIVGRKPWRFSALLWLDALGMAAYTVVGTAKALSFGAPPVSAVVMGVLTAAFGGIVRDVLANEPSILLRREIYITAALAGAAVFVVLIGLGAPYSWAGGAGFAVALGIRSGALLFGWTMPAFPGSPTED
ncbi:trimeric intracellular cation channel family protein [Caulobacter sp. 73W]|uniref:Trimeric intracellular cation channel family protein n=1 Tax=Caulobacter sp. 73W TaxID=3161137 RepID=A0AB39KW79_9CAUL